jgi:hypothetical protein
MATQSYEHHAHWPMLMVAGTAFWVFGAIELTLWFINGGRRELALGLSGLFLAVAALLWISRRYTTALQDRIIKLEMRTRGAALLTPDQQRQLAGLAKPQLVALRFASDAELPALLDRAVRERLSADDIKRAIRNWVPDRDRT